MGKIADRAVEGYKKWMEDHYDDYKKCAEEFERGGLDALVACLKGLKKSKTVTEVVEKYKRKITGT